MWGRGRNRPNPGMVPVWGRSSSNRGMGSSSSLCRTYGRTAFSSSRGGDDGRRGHNSGDGGNRGRAVAAVVGGGASTVVVGPGLDLPAWRGEERRTRGLTLCPPRVFTMAGLEEERRGWEKESLRGDGEEMEWLGMKMKGGGGFK